MSGRVFRGVMIVAAVLVALVGFTPAGMAASDAAAGVAAAGDAQPRGGIVVVPAAPEAGSDASVEPFGANCGGVLDPCGIVNNRTTRSLEAARDSRSHTSCPLWADSTAHPRKSVAPGRNSNQSPEHFKDTDCFRSTTCSVFYLGWHAPGEWIRIWSSVHIHDLGC
ncbi:hypothetical protein KCV87_02575 [Actinosynnema pretiosum subsp. pretiosum]|uniref:Secreted protein n=1 Tax=Actinosynnema pretiosum subsp. pretiosum TaxID=103721 RepID=A0AA45R4Q7_9PSEU|nr:hypothetical protein KCV87_02575 [Actinosynnema pretiosum subsp. pretiosum]